MLVLIRGAGDIATGVALRLHRCGFSLILTELPRPTAVRRTVAFSEAVYHGSATVEGVTYYLPRTALRLVVVAEKQVYTPGEFSKYADRYLRLSQINQEPYTKWSIKSIDMVPYGVPDPQKVYSIQLKKRTVAPLVGLTSEGILLSINTDGEEEPLPAVPKGNDAPKRLNPRDYMNQEILSAGSNAKIAELTAEEIYDIRDSRTALIKGEADNMPKDGAQLKLMLDQLTMQETALTQLFKGTVDTSTEVFTIELTPAEFTDRMVLFRFSEKLGVVDNDDLSGEPVYLSLKNMNTLPQPVVDEKAAKKKGKMEEGVYYNVPERVAVSVFNASREFCKGEFPMGQFGHVEILSNVLFDKKTTTQVTFYPSNGAIKQLTDNGEEN